MPPPAASGNPPYPPACPRFRSTVFHIFIISPPMNTLRRFPLTMLCIAAIWALCLLKPPSTRLDTIDNFDKVVHVTMYLVLGCLWWWEYWRSGLRLRPVRLLLFAVVLPVLMSGLIELVQEYCTATRSGDWADFLANTAGVLLAAAAGRLLLPRLARPRR